MKCPAGGTLVQHIPIENNEEMKDMEVNVVPMDVTGLGGWFSFKTYMKLRMGGHTKDNFPVTFKPKW